MSGGTALAAGEYLRTWRQRRRMSQLEFALEAEISQRHLSFLESGRSVPSRDMLLHLAERLEVPLRDRNAMLLAAGYAPVYAERSLEDPAMAAARQAIELVLKGHEPYPALAVDRTGVRLGRGRGFYDRSLPDRDPRSWLIAMVRDEELVDELPADPHDVPMTHALTPRQGVIALSRNSRSGE